MDEDIQRRIRDIINEIEDKSADSDYIYRGEPETHGGPPYYGKVSSSLWREYGIEGENFDIEIIQREMLNGAKKHIGDLPQDFRIDLIVSLNAPQEESDKTIDFEILTEIQHYGGQTNLIDFTTDYFIALFFACDGHHDEDGRVILQKAEDIHNLMEHPRNPRHRVIAQKSVFVRPPKGFIEPHEDDIVPIPGELKQWILQNLRKYHDISTETIYNDLYGFIRNQEIHGDAYTRFYKGYACEKRGDEAIDSEERQKKYEKSIEHFTQAIILEPNFFEAYHNRGVIYSKKELYDLAIVDFNKTIELNPNLAEPYFNRGGAYIEIGEVDSAIEDCTRAIELNSNHAEAYNNRGNAYSKKDEYDIAIEDYNKAIELNPNSAETYSNRGVAYKNKGEIASAIEDYTKAINMNPDFAGAYSNRGEALLHFRKWEKAKKDLIAAKKMDFDIIASFYNDYTSVEDFQNKNGFELPDEIAEMLTST